MPQTKYNFEIPIEDVEKNIRRLINQLWKLIPMRENKENWKTHLESLIIEIAGLNEILQSFHVLQQLLSKLEGLYIQDTDFFIYRKTVFECLTLLKELNNGIKI